MKKDNLLSLAFSTQNKGLFSAIYIKKSSKIDDVRYLVGDMF